MNQGESAWGVQGERAGSSQGDRRDPGQTPPSLAPPPTAQAKQDRICLAKTCSQSQKETPIPGSAK